MGKNTKTAGCYILHDENAIDNLEAQHFDPVFWQGKPGFERIQGGRGGSVKISIVGRAAILRRYFRGGMIARWVSDKYLWLGKRSTRPWREWAMIRHALAAGLPVPEPIGIFVQRTGIFYRAAIITAFIENTETLANYLTRNKLDEDSWRRLGALLHRMHVQCIYHADLNANNLLIDPQGQFFIIDFDRARLMKRLGGWQWKPLNRLLRSLEKIDRLQGLHYRPGDWQALMAAYRSAEK